VPSTDLVIVSLAALLALYASIVIILFALGRRGEARPLVRFIPDCLVLFRRLLADDRVPRLRKVSLVLMVGYLALPIDLIPDFIPVAGQLDDAILVALTLRFVLHGSGRALVEEHWPGPPEGLSVVQRFAFAPGADRRQDQ
jgi:uncharacterized membrane protein YkvA (DUF1232 family)